MLDFGSPPHLHPAALLQKSLHSKGTADEAKVLPHDSLDQVSLIPISSGLIFFQNNPTWAAIVQELASSSFFFNLFYFAKEYETLKRDINKTPESFYNRGWKKKSMGFPMKPTFILGDVNCRKEVIKHSEFSRPPMFSSNPSFATNFHCHHQ